MKNSNLARKIRTIREDRCWTQEEPASASEVPLLLLPYSVL